VSTAETSHYVTTAQVFYCCADLLADVAASFPLLLDNFGDGRLMIGAAQACRIHS
jgi:hypothetical protein